MKKIIYFALGFGFLYALYDASFILLEKEQAIVLQLGKSVRSIKKSGVNLKIPFIQEVVKFDKRVLQLDGSPAEAPTLDKKYIVVDTTARWKIKDPLKFFKTLRNIPNAVVRMEAVFDGITKDTVSSVGLSELVRNSNRIFSDLQENKSSEEENKIHLGNEGDTLEHIKLGREKISEIIADRARKELLEFGISLVDVQLRSIAYKKEVEEKVYKRMVSERMSITSEIRSSGAGQKQEILGQLDLSLKTIESQAYKKAQQIRGEADAKAMRIFNKELEANPEYFEYVKTLESYKKSLPKAKLVLSTNNKFLQMLNK
jgi:modulator of FtsH protease HflC